MQFTLLLQCKNSLFSRELELPYCCVQHVDFVFSFANFTGLNTERNPTYVEVQPVIPHCIASVQETERKMLVLWLRNGTEVLVNAADSCSVRPEAECPEE